MLSIIQNGYYKESRSYITVYGNQLSSDLKCGAGHRGYQGKGIIEGVCTRNPED